MKLRAMPKPGVAPIFEGLTVGASIGVLNNPLSLVGPSSLVDLPWCAWNETDYIREVTPLGNIKINYNFREAPGVHNWESCVSISGNEDSEYVKVEVCRDLLGRSPVGAIRGDIVQFSRESRKRMMDTLCKMQSTVLLPQFMTITYPDEFPHDSAIWKTHLDKICKRIVRKYPNASAVWKLEPQTRGAPHFHFIIYGVPFTRDFKQWLSQSWYEVVDSGDDKHLKAGTNIEPVRSRRGVKAYASKKYMGKELAAEEMAVHAENIAGWRNPGRFWGVMNRKALPLGRPFYERVPLDEAGDIIRTARKVYRNKTGRNVYRTSNSITLYVSANQFRKIIPGKEKSSIRLSKEPLNDGVEYVRLWLVKMKCDKRFLGRDFTEQELRELRRVGSPMAWFLSLQRDEFYLPLGEDWPVSSLH